jgi:hypothetical protein
MKARIWGWVVVVVCFAFFLPAAQAQYRAGLQGTVLDPQGSVVSGATVTLLNLETNHSDKVTTSAAGVYTFTGLPPAHYSITVEKQGFTKKVLADVQIAAEQMQALNISLEVGQVSQTVTVSGSSTPLIDTETGQVGGTLSANDVQKLPSFGRDPYQLLRLAPGIFGDSSLTNGGDSQGLPGTEQNGSGATSSIFMTENQPQIVAGGQRASSNSYEVDGVSVNSLDWGGSAIITPSEESIKEVRITSNSYDAEYGRGSAAQVEVVSQSGTNNIHGSAFFKFDRPGLNAYQPWNGPSGPEADERVSNRFNQFGGSVGGPIIKNKLFAFFSYETLRNDSVLPGTTWVETPQYLAAVAGLTGNISGTYAGFPGEAPTYSAVLPSSCAQANLSSTQCQAVGGGLDIGSFSKVPHGALDPTYGAVATPFGVGGGLDGIPDVQYVSTINPTTITATQYNGRMDYQFNQANLFTYSIYWVPNDTTNYNNSNARAASLYNSDRLNYSQSLMWSHTFSPTLVNELRFNVGRWYYNELQTNPQEPWGLPLDNINGIGAVGGITYGAGNPGVLYKTGYNIRDIATKVFSQHSLKFGVDFYKEQNTQTYGYGSTPVYNFNNLWDFANDAPVQEYGQFNATTGVPTFQKSYVRDNDYAAFLQDDWKIKPNLTINLGLRYEYFGPFHEKYNNLATTVLGAAPNQLTDLSLRLGGNLYNASKGDFGPQIGFAWSPNGVFGHDFQSKLVIRGGFGIGYNRTENAITLGALTNTSPIYESTTLFGSNILYALPSDPKTFAPYPANPNTILTFNPQTNIPVSGAPISLEAFPRNLVTPYTYRYSLLAQYDLGHDMVATVGYQGSASHHLLRWNFDGQILFEPQNPQVNGLELFEDDVDANYNALLTEINKRFSHGFQIDAQYTYSKNMDDASNNYYFDTYPFNAKAAYGPSDNDVTHNFKLWGIWSPSFFSEGWKHKVLDGWTMSGIFNAHSGFPWTPQYGVSVTGFDNECSLIFENSGYCNLRPAAYNGGAGTNYSNKTFKQTLGNFPNGPDTYFTPPTLTLNGVPAQPGVGRNSFRGPRYSNVDFTLSKSFGLPKAPVLGENAALEIRANFYNIFNQLNLVPWNTQNIGTILLQPDGTQVNPTAANGNASQTFDQAQNGLAGRVIEMQVRFSF